MTVEISEHMSVDGAQPKGSRGTKRKRGGGIGIVDEACIPDSSPPFQYTRIPILLHKTTIQTSTVNLGLITPDPPNPNPTFPFILPNFANSRILSYDTRGTHLLFDHNTNTARFYNIWRAIEFHLPPIPAKLHPIVGFRGTFSKSSTLYNPFPPTRTVLLSDCYDSSEAIVRFFMLALNAGDEEWTVNSIPYSEDRAHIYIVGPMITPGNVTLFFNRSLQVETITEEGVHVLKNTVFDVLVDEDLRALYPTGIIRHGDFIYFFQGKLHDGEGSDPFLARVLINQLLDPVAANEIELMDSPPVGVDFFYTEKGEGLSCPTLPGVENCVFMASRAIPEGHHLLVYDNVEDGHHTSTFVCNEDGGCTSCQFSYLFL